MAERIAGYLEGLLNGLAVYTRGGDIGGLKLLIGRPDNIKLVQQRIRVPGLRDNP